MPKIFDLISQIPIQEIKHTFRDIFNSFHIFFLALGRLFQYDFCAVWLHVEIGFYKGSNGHGTHVTHILKII